MQEHPDVDPISKDAPRVQLDLPNVYWTLTTQFATIIGMYTNVPEHGSIDSTQQQWVTNEFATAPKDAMKTGGCDRVVLGSNEGPDGRVAGPRKRGRSRTSEMARGQANRDEQIIDRSAPTAGRISGARIGAANMRAKRAAQPVRIGIEPKAVQVRGACVNAGN